MAGTKKSSSSKKKKSGRGKVKVAAAAATITPTPANPPADINDVLAQADVALESSNVETAMQLYTYAADVLRNQLQALSTNMAASNKERESTALRLSKILGKMAETKVSMGDQQGGQQDFLEATNLLSGDGPTGDQIARAQWKEARASLYLYLGQLSGSNDALEAFTRAITDLKDCVGLLEEGVKNCVTMDHDSSEDSLEVDLVETR